MKLIYRLILFIFSAFIVLIFLWAVFSPQEDLSQRINETIKKQEQKADLTFKDVSFEEIDNGQKYWQVAAKTAMINKSSQQASLKDSNGTFFKAGNPVLRFRSPAAIWDMGKKEIYLDKPLGYDISLENKIASLLKKSTESQPSSIFSLPVNGDKTAFWFLANNLSWKLADKKILCTGNIVIKKGEVVGYSQKLKADVAMEQVVIEGNPKVIISPPKNSAITLEADIFTILTPEDTITAQGSPRVFWQQATISAQTIRYLAKDKQLEFLNQVKITYQDIFAWGDQAIYDVTNNEILLAGHARAKQGESRLRGEKVKVSLKQNKISVLGQGKFTISEKELN